LVLLERLHVGKGQNQTALPNALDFIDQNRKRILRGNMNKFVKLAWSKNVVGVITDHTRHHGGVSVEVHYHNGIKPVHRLIEERAFTEITAAEFEQVVRKKGQTSMLQYLKTTETETIVWHTDPEDLPTINEYCLVVIKGGSGVEGRARFTGQNWRMIGGYNDDDCEPYCNEKDFIKAWAYEPKGPTN
jgi:hypothetical protein